ncbi:hypothetical protein HK096_005174 [Nowakowskiella sp. JEL0078]|nr:hypothetical protein HK096_005174 [Nowakowskiella sp. JEL0078]
MAEIANSENIDENIQPEFGKVLTLRHLASLPALSNELAAWFLDVGRFSLHLSVFLFKAEPVVRFSEWSLAVPSIPLLDSSSTRILKFAFKFPFYFRSFSLLEIVSGQEVLDATGDRDRISPVVYMNSQDSKSSGAILGIEWISAYELLVVTTFGVEFCSAEHSLIFVSSGPKQVTLFVVTSGNNLVQLPTPKFEEHMEEISRKNITLTTLYDHIYIIISVTSDSENQPKLQLYHITKSRVYLKYELNLDHNGSYQINTVDNLLLAHNLTNKSYRPNLMVSPLDGILYSLSLSLNSLISKFKEQSETIERAVEFALENLKEMIKHKDELSKVRSIFDMIVSGIVLDKQADSRYLLGVDTYLNNPNDRRSSTSSRHSVSSSSANISNSIISKKLIEDNSSDPNLHLDIHTHISIDDIYQNIFKPLFEDETVDQAFLTQCLFQFISSLGKSRLSNHLTELPGESDLLFLLIKLLINQSEKEEGILAVLYQHIKCGIFASSVTIAQYIISSSTQNDIIGNKPKGAIIVKNSQLWKIALVRKAINYISDEVILKSNLLAVKQAVKPTTYSENDVMVGSNQISSETSLAIYQMISEQNNKQSFSNNDFTGIAKVLVAAHSSGDLTLFLNVYRFLEDFGLIPSGTDIFPGGHGASIVARYISIYREIWGEVVSMEELL